MVKSEVAIIGLGTTSKLAALALATDVRRVTIYGEENPNIYKSNLVTFFSTPDFSVYVSLATPSSSPYLDSAEIG